MQRSRLEKYLPALLVSLSFFPYIGVGIGKNSSIHGGSLMAIALIGYVVRNKKLFHLLAIFICLVFLNFLCAALADPSHLNPPAYLLLILNILPAFLLAALLLNNPLALIWPLRFWITVVSLYALVQKYFFLDNGNLPFVGYYNLPGYASVEGNLFVITSYIRRPFAFFPEPSFLAATLLLASIALALSLRLSKNISSGIDLLLFGLVGVVLYVSGSGSSVIGLGALVIIVTTTVAKKSFRPPILALGAMAAVFVASDILGQRARAFNWSWDDRSASILGAFRFWVEDVARIFFGVGQGRLTSLFGSGQIDLGGFRYFNAIPDMYSVVGRLMIESGLVIGSLIIGFMVYSLYTAFRAVTTAWSAILAVTVWFVAGGLTTSYQSASWIWFLPMAAWAIKNGQVSSTEGVGFSDRLRVNQ